LDNYKIGPVRVNFILPCFPHPPSQTHLLFWNAAAFAQGKITILTRVYEINEKTRLKNATKTKKIGIAQIARNESTSAALGSCILYLIGTSLPISFLLSFRTLE
jgi:hypothetical protein